MAGRQFFLFSCILLAIPFSAKADENLVELVKKIKWGCMNKNYPERAEEDRHRFRQLADSQINKS